jgi:alcohol dehydrogenase class IV
MTLDTPTFNHQFQPGTIRFGRGCIEGLSEALTKRGHDTVLVVTGRNVGASEAVMGSVRDGLRDHSVEVFDETTPAKKLETVFDGIRQVERTSADAIVGVGGGSSLDLATGIAALAGSDYTLETARKQVIENGILPLPAANTFLPMVSVPTTLAGADFSVAAGLVAPSDEGPVETIIADEGLMPTTLYYDPDLFDTTPMSVLTGSAINGFNKGIEAIYSAYATPVTDSTAVRGLQYLRESLPRLRNADHPEVMEQAVLGTMLVQYGVSVPDAYKINIVHAFGHGLRNQFGIQQGIAHAVVVPHALKLILDKANVRVDLLVEGLVQESDPADPEAAVIQAIEEIRNGLGLPTRLRDVEGTSESELRQAAKRTAHDDLIDVGPADFDPSIDEIEATLHEAW